MSRLTEKFKAAGAVVGEVYKHAEDNADKLIARKDELKGKTTSVFKAHNMALDEASKGLDAFERDLALVSNDPLGSSGDSQEELTPVPATKPPELSKANPEPPLVRLGPHPDQPAPAIGNQRTFDRIGG